MREIIHPQAATKKDPPAETKDPTEAWRQTDPGDIEVRARPPVEGGECRAGPTEKELNGPCGERQPPASRLGALRARHYGVRALRGLAFRGTRLIIASSREWVAHRLRNSPKGTTNFPPARPTSRTFRGILLPLQTSNYFCFPPVGCDTEITGWARRDAEAHTEARRHCTPARDRRQSSSCGPEQTRMRIKR